MAQFYTLEEAARVLGMSPEELKNKAQHREIRAFMDSGSWRFRVADIDELARRRGMGSDPELSLSDLDLSVPTGGSASDEINLSEFQLGTVKPDLGPQSIQGLPAFEAEKDVQFDEFALPQGGAVSNSSSTILGMDQSGKLPSDSDVRVMPELLTGPSDSDVRLAPIPSRGPGDSDVTLVNDDQSLGDFTPVSGSSDTAIRQSPLLGSSAEVSAADAGSDFELTPSNVIDALQPESGSDFELTALDHSDEFESTPMLAAGPGDSDVTAAEPTASGINLGRPSDSGINLGGVGLENLPADSIELSPLSGDEIKAFQPPKPAANPAKPKPSLAATPPPATAKGEKDIFDDTDFSLEVDAFDSGGDSSEHEDKTVQLDRGSDFEIDDSDSASEVFALDEDEVDTSAATAMAPAVTDDESGEFSADDGGDMGGSGWDVESESVPTRGAASSASAGSPVLTSAAAAAEWSGVWVGVLGFASFLMLLALFISFDLIRNLYEYKGGSLVGSGLIKSIAGLFGG